MQIANTCRFAVAGALLAVSSLTHSALAQAQFAGTYIGTINTRVTVPVVGTIESGAGAYIANVSADGTINVNSGALVGTVSASGAVTFPSGSGLAALGVRSATIANNQLSSAYGDVLGNGTTQFRLNPSTSFTGGGGGGGGGSSVPSITSGDVIPVALGQSFVYPIVATNSPTSYSLRNNPSWVTLASTPPGVVNGTPPSVGTFTFEVEATNAAGTGRRTITITVSGGSGGGGGSSGGLVANYAFNGNLTDAVTGTNANLFNGVTYVPGVSGQALQFDGNGSVVTYSSAPLVTSDGPFSVSFWFRPTAARIMVPVRVRTPATEFATRIGLNANDSSSLGASLYFGFRGSAGIISRDPRFYIESILNQWMHLTFVYKGGNKSSAASFDLIVNGERLALSTVGTIGGTSNTNEIGRDGSNSSYVVGNIDEFRITSSAIDLSAATALYAIAPTVTGVSTAPTNLVGYRNKVGQTFSFVVTGATGGPVWGTDIYTDDSSVGRAAVHAGVVAPGETKTVSVTLLPGQSSYPASTRNGVTSAAWGAWSGSYSFAGAGGATGTATAAPTVVYAPPATQTVTIGGRLNLSVTVGGVGPFTYQWFLNGTAINGAISALYNIASVSSANAGNYTVRATNSAGTTTINAGTISVANAGAPSITLQPFSKVVAPGARVSLLVSATGSGNLSYQWRRGGTAIPGATRNGFEISPATAAASGTYTCTITNASGSLTTDGAVVTVSSSAARPANISCRTRLAAGGDVTPGFYVDGTGSKRVLVRAVGPALAGFGVDGAHTNPRFDVYRGSTIIASNDDFDATAAAAFGAAGAFTLPAGSRDAALVVNLTAGQGYTVRVGGVGSASGIVLLEVYDLDDPATATSRLSNVSVLGGVGTGDDVLILGVVVGGPASVNGQSNKRTLLIRGAGPTLGGAPFNVPGVLGDPQIEIFDSNNRSVLDNNDWNNAPFVAELQLASTYVSAFAFGAGSKDAATLALLDPGAYTIVVKGSDGGTGQSLVEVYEVP